MGVRLYQLATGALSPLARPILQWRARRGKEDPERMTERLGLASRPRPAGSLVWLHGASVGESLSLLPLIDGLRQRRTDVTLLVTSGTVASAKLMDQRLPAFAIHQYAPVDTPAVARRFVRHWRPDLCIFVESEIWPNLLFQAKSIQSSLTLLSARLSDKSLRRWARAPRTARAVFGVFDLVQTQSDAAAGRLSRLGARDDGRINLKRLGAPLPVDERQLRELRRLADGRPVLLAASTHGGEDQIVLAAFSRVAQGALLVIVPRHPVRADEIQTLAAEAGFSSARRSKGQAFGAADVYLADTLGELGLWFSLANAAFIGGSLVIGPGGHNPLEAAQLHCPLIVGPHLDNWKDIYAELFAAKGAVSVDGQETLAEAFAGLVSDPAAAERQARQAFAAVVRDRSSLSATIERLMTLIP